MEGVEIDEKINTLTKQLEEAQKIAEEADKRYDEVSWRLCGPGISVSFCFPF